jgi:hypothetical protein
MTAVHGKLIPAWLQRSCAAMSRKIVRCRSDLGSDCNEHRTLSGRGTSALAEALVPAVPIGRCSPTTSGVSNADLAGRPCAAICGYSAGLTSPSIVPAGNCRSITR